MGSNYLVFLFCDQGAVSKENYLPKHDQIRKPENDWMGGHERVLVFVDPLVKHAEKPP